MPVRAVVFDLGSVLEVIEPMSAWLEPWAARLGRPLPDVLAAVESVDPDREAGMGGLGERDLRAGYAAALDLTADQADALMADMWVWYCGTPDEALFAYARSLRPTIRTAILTNSVDGGRREEQLRYDLASSFDPIVYSHEEGCRKPDPAVYAMVSARLGLAPDEIAFLDDVEANVDAARTYGWHAVRHVDTPTSIAALDTLLGR